MTSNNIWLTRNDVKLLTELFEEFPDSTQVELIADSSSGIGTYLKVAIHDVKMFKSAGTVTFTLKDEKDW